MQKQSISLWIMFSGDCFFSSFFLFFFFIICFLFWFFLSVLGWFAICFGGLNLWAVLSDYFKFSGVCHSNINKMIHSRFGKIKNVRGLTQTITQVEKYMFKIVETFLKTVKH